MANKREYKINIDPRILELLGPSLYTNIYYVLAELIANAYDADASNVYVIQRKDRIIVEDDGTGMSYKDGDILKYLDVAVETRTTKQDSYTSVKKRRKIGRKGVGKLAALSVSQDVLVMTIKDGEKSGFVLSRHVEKSHLLEGIDDDDIGFEFVTEKGTSIVMTNPQYGMHKTVAAIKNNLLKIFPLVDSDFRVHVVTDEEEYVIESFDKEIIQGLASLIILGDEFRHLSEYFDPGIENIPKEIMNKLLKVEAPIGRSVTMKNKAGKQGEYDLEIKGWIGAYRTTRDRKKYTGDFPDNFISLIANSKLGEYNILPNVGKNKLVEVYVVGQLHVDLLEETELPDIALSNRQGYKTDDPRYTQVVGEVRDKLLPRIINMRKVYVDQMNVEKNEKKREKQAKAEEELRRKVEEYKATASKEAASKIAKQLGTESTEEIEQIIEGEMNASLSLVGIKSKVDAHKKKILICHAQMDKTMADVIYKMLSFNNISDADIIYTSCDNADARVPEDTGVFDYLREFFVNSYSDTKIMVLYVTSDEMAKSWGAVAEVGAGWITKKDHKVFNIKDHKPRRPLNIDHEWQTSVKIGDRIEMKTVEFDKFVEKILKTCETLGFSPKPKQANEKELKRYVTLGID